MGEAYFREELVHLLHSNSAEIPYFKIADLVISMPDRIKAVKNNREASTK